MADLASALVHAGLVAPSPPTASAVPVVAAPCSDAIGSRCHALVAVLGASAARGLLSEVSVAPYGRARRIERLNSAIEARLDQLPSKQSQELRVDALRWDFGSSADLDDTLSLCLEAIDGGGYAVWAAAQQQAAKAPRWPLPSTVEQLSDLTLGDAREMVRAWLDQVSAWAGERTERELRALGYDWYAISHRGDELLRLAETARTERLRDQGQMRAIVEDYDSGELSWDEATTRLKALPYDVAAAEEAVLGKRFEDACLRRTPRAFRDGRALKTTPLAAVAVWERLSSEVLDTYCRREMPEAIVHRASQLLPGQGWSTAHAPDTQPQVVLPNGTVVWADFGAGVPDGLVSTVESPAGWWDSTPRHSGWRPTQVYTALQHLRAVPRGTLDVRRVIGTYGRHDTERWPRLREVAWKTPLIVGIDDELGERFDVLASVPAHLVPEHAWWIPGSCRATAKNGLRLTHVPAPDRSVLVLLEGGTMSHGRHGTSGANVAPHASNQAPCASVCGGSRGGGQSRSVLIGCVAAGRPLLLADGSGYELTADGGLYYVPGLASGRPGARKAV
jgi:hypothetical protein